jgi:hypothetical protein
VVTGWSATGATSSAASSTRPRGEPQLGERGQRLGGQPALAGVRRAQRVLELGLGRGPVAGGDQDLAVVQPAERVEMRRPVAPGERAGGAHPLRRALELGGTAAGHDHVAARVDDGLELLALTAERRGHRLVEQRGALGDPPLVDERDADLAQRAQLEVAVAEATGGLARRTGQPLRFHGVLAVVGARTVDPARQRR